jgi:hypothetical protein
MCFKKWNKMKWRVSSSGIWRRVVYWVTSDVSEEHIVSIFRVEEIISARTSKPPTYLQVLAEIISSTQKMEAICSSESSVATQQTTLRHIPEDDTLKTVMIIQLRLGFPSLVWGKWLCSWKWDFYICSVPRKRPAVNMDVERRAVALS